MTAPKLAQPARPYRNIGNSHDTLAIWAQLRAIAKSRGLTQRDLARLMFRTQSGISNIDVRARAGQPPRLETCAELAQILGLEIHVSLHKQANPSASRSEVTK